MARSKADRHLSKMPTAQKQIYEKIKDPNGCMDQVRTLNEISGNPLSDIELGQLCKDLQSIANNDLSIGKSDQVVDRPSRQPRIRGGRRGR